MIISVIIPRQIAEQWPTHKLETRLIKFGSDVRGRFDLFNVTVNSSLTMEHHVQIHVHIPDSVFNEDLLDSLKTIIKQDIGDFDVTVHDTEREKKKFNEKMPSLSEHIKRPSSPSQATGDSSMKYGDENKVHPIRIETKNELDCFMAIDHGRVEIMTSRSTISLSSEQLRGIMSVAEAIYRFSELEDF